MIYLNKNDLGKNVYRITLQHILTTSYYVKANSRDEAGDIVSDFGGINNDEIRSIVDENSEQLSLDFVNADYDSQSIEFVGKVVSDENDNDEVELDKLATELKTA
ncbi:hypothetical protein EBU71_00300 [bacterium]|nr:hypothetical protein [Candidatus Elulimicrobium humile]